MNGCLGGLCSCREVQESSEKRYQQVTNLNSNGNYYFYKLDKEVRLN